MKVVHKPICHACSLASSGCTVCWLHNLRPWPLAQKTTPWLCRVGEHDDATAVAQQATEYASADARPAAWLATQAAAMGCHNDAVAWLDRAAEVTCCRNCIADKSTVRVGEVHGLHDQKSGNSEIRKSP